MEGDSVRKVLLLVGAVVFSSLVVLLGLSIGGQVHAAGDPVLVGAGDIATCRYQTDEATSKLLGSIPGTVITLGDNAYPQGTYQQFTDCYGPSWGHYKDRTKPSVGNHDYSTTGASGYYKYFGAKAGDPSKGYYSYERGSSWHIVVLNSNCWKVRCAAGSTQEKWLKADLAAHPKKCTLAYFHHPRFSSAGNNYEVSAFWQDLYKAHAEVVLNGHVHAYERFAPQRPDGTLAPKSGIREFVVGTGGEGLGSFNTVKPNSQVRNANTFGVLKLTLHSSSYEWRFKPVAGKSFTDSGTTDCH
jgi:acid phosphatase type 7